MIKDCYQPESYMNHGLETPEEGAIKNADKFKEVFGIYATELWGKSECEFLNWLNSIYRKEK